MLRMLIILLFLLLTGCGGGGEAGNPDQEISVADARDGGLPSPSDDADLGREIDSEEGVDPGSAAGIPAGEGGVVEELAIPSAGSGSSIEAGSAGVEREEARFPHPEHVRGIYLNASSAGSRARRGHLLELARRTEINSFVIDIKDASGYVSFNSRVPLARAVGATARARIRDLPALLAELEEAGIYPIARIVVAKDPILAEARPDLAIQDTAGGAWLDQKDVKWLNFHHPEVWQYHLDLAEEVAEAGFPEIQWDYVRFPDAPESLLARAVYPGGEGRSKSEAVRLFLSYTRDVLGAKGVRVTADVFGVTTSYRRDVGIGQLWEAFIDKVDVALPMVYPSHYWTGSFGFEKPNAHPYEIVRRALRDALRRSSQVEGAGTTRPWLQDFSLGDPPYGPPEIRAQIQATYDAGIQEWILWNPGSRYTESALIPARGLPSWLEPVMRVGGEVVPLSQRFEVLGEEGESSVGAPAVLEDPPLATPRALPPAGGLPSVPLAEVGEKKPEKTKGGRE